MRLDEASPVADGAAFPQLVSVVVVAYRQEAYIREAVRSAMAQTYPNLEIILCDDCSPDGTFEIMTEEAEAYRGPHRVILNRNPVNLGVAGNYNRAAELASGDLMVVQDGDDVSRPDRVVILERAAREPTPVDLVCSTVSVIDKVGQPGPSWNRPAVTPLTLNEALEAGTISVLGCACAYARSLWTTYGPIDPEVLQEDVVLPFRALLGQGVRVVDDPLVDYRWHGENLFAGQNAARSRSQGRRWARSTAAIARDWRRDWVHSGRDAQAFDRIFQSRMTLRVYDAELYDRSRGHALMAAIRGLGQGLTLRNAAGLIKRHVFRLA